MSEVSDFFEWADNPEIPMMEVRKRYEELKASGVFGQETPPREELLFISGEPELFWRHMIELRSFEDIRCWTDGEVVVVPKNDKDAVQYILQCLNGKFVNRQLD